MRGAMTLYLSPETIKKKEEIIDVLKEAFPKELLNSNEEIMYPLIDVRVDEFDDKETKDKLKNNEIVFSRYNQQLNTWKLHEESFPEVKDIAPCVTFYSYKGGVGRSTALAIVARVLASNGHKVAVVDLDLEAPGINSLLLSRPVTSAFGVVDYLYHQPWLGENLSRDVFLNNYIIKEDVPSFYRNKSPGQLWVMAAGGTSIDNIKEESLRLIFAERNDVEIKLDKNYLKKLSYIDFDLYVRQQQNVFRKLLKDISEYTGADLILLDARTGISNVSGALLNQFSQLISIHFQDNKQNREGLELLTNELDYDLLYNKVIWSHTKSSKEYRHKERTISINNLIVSLLQKKNSVCNDKSEDEFGGAEGNIKFLKLPFADQLEDLSAKTLTEYIQDDYIPVPYKVLADMIATGLGLDKKSSFYLRPDLKENIYTDLLALTREFGEAFYFSKRFLSSDLTQFVGFPGSGKKTFSTYMREQGREVSVIGYFDFAKLVADKKMVLSNTIFLDWNESEAAQAVCKLLLRANAFYEWIKSEYVRAGNISAEELELSRSDETYELPKNIVDSIIDMTFGKSHSRGFNRTGWTYIFNRLQYRRGHVLPKDLMTVIRSLITHFVNRHIKLNKEDENGGAYSSSLFPQVIPPISRRIFTEIGNLKREWLGVVDIRLLHLVEAIISEPINSISFKNQESNWYEHLEDKLFNKYPTEFTEKSLQEVIQLAKDMSIVQLEDSKLLLSPVYRNIMYSMHN